MVKFRRWHIPPRRLVLWHTVASLPLGIVVILGAYLSFHYHTLSMESRARVDRAYEVLDRVNALFISVEDAEIAERDFIITGAETNLVPFQAAVDAVAPNAAKLRQLMPESPNQLQALSQLESAMSAKFVLMARDIQARRDGGFNVAQALILQGRDKASMDQIRTLTDAMVARERSLLMRRQEVGRERERDTLLVGILIAALSVATRLLIAWALALIRRRVMATPATARDDAPGDTAGNEPAHHPPAHASPAAPGKARQLPQR